MNLSEIQDAGNAQLEADLNEWTKTWGGPSVRVEGDTVIFTIKDETAEPSAYDKVYWQNYINGWKAENERLAELRRR